MTTTASETPHQAAQRRKRERTLFGIDLKGKRGVEIGPLSLPLVAKSAAEVVYVDHSTTEELVARYRDTPINTADIVDVDFVCKGEPLSELLQDSAPFDFVVASHVIEHVPDLIGWLSDCLSLLRPGGVLCLVIPDKRYTFDARRGTASFSEIVAAHLEKRKRPSLRCVVDHHANAVAAQTHELWANPEIAETAKFYSFDADIQAAVDAYRNGDYLDVHCWVFTPDTFKRLLGLVLAYTALPFRMNYFLDTPKNDLEFYAQLTRLS